MNRKLLLVSVINACVLVVLPLLLGRPVLTLTDSAGNVAISLQYFPTSSRVALLRVGAAVFAVTLVLLVVAMVLRLLLLDRRRLAELRSLFWRPEKSRPCGLNIPPRLWKTPDPFLYSQYYLIRQGLDVTWDNPDIFLVLPRQHQ